MEIKKKSIIEYDILRCFLVICVIITHCSYTHIVTSYGAIYNYEIFNDIFISKVFSKFINFINVFQMPFFFILSGALYNIDEQKGKYNKISSLLNRKKKLLILFIIVCVCYSIPIKYFSHYFDGVSLWGVIKGQLLGFGNNYLWFLVVLFSIHIIFYALNKTNKKINIVLASLLYILSFFGISSNNFINAILQYYIFFLIGYIFESKRETLIKKNFFKNSNFYIISILLINIILLFLNNSILELISKEILKMILMYCTFIFIFGLCIKYRDNEKVVQNKLYKTIRENSLQLYLYADPINYLLLYACVEIAESLVNNNVFRLGLIVLRIVLQFVIGIYIGKIISYFQKKVRK